MTATVSSWTNTDAYCNQAVSLMEQKLPLLLAYHIKFPGEATAIWDELGKEVYDLSETAALHCEATDVRAKIMDIVATALRNFTDAPEEPQILQLQASLALLKVTNLTMTDANNCREGWKRLGIDTDWPHHRDHST